MIKNENYKTKDAARQMQERGFRMVFTIRLMLAIGQVFLKFWQWVVCLIYERF